MERKRLTYRDAGVDVRAGDALVERISERVRCTFGPEVLTGLGGFGGLYALETAGVRTPVLVAGTDGVGTKLKIAFAAGRHDTVGIDLVAMCVNDVLVPGARPLFFLDYLATGRLEVGRAAEVIEGMVEGCRRAGCALIGGETAEMPDFYPAGEYDLAGFAVGIVDRERILDGSAIRPGDRILGIASSGLHSNGYSLVRKIVFDLLGLDLSARPAPLERPLADVLLEPTRIYTASLLPLIRSGYIKGLAHITGGGIPGNLRRILPQDAAAQIRKGSWEVPPIFSFLQEGGGVEEEEMFATFNMGIGMAAVVSVKHESEVLGRLREEGETAWSVGEIIPGRREVIVE